MSAGTLQKALSEMQNWQSILEGQVILTTPQLPTKATNSFQGPAIHPTRATLAPVAISSRAIFSQGHFNPGPAFANHPNFGSLFFALAKDEVLPNNHIYSLFIFVMVTNLCCWAETILHLSQVLLIFQAGHGCRLFIRSPI